VNDQDKAITIKDNSYTLLDKDGNEVSNTPAFAEDGTTEIGTFSIDPATGQVTYTPTDKSYTGKVTPVKVQAESSNGIKVDTTYTPEIVPVTPTATPAESTDIQGATQKGKPEFKGGTVTVDGVEKTVEINEDVQATFDDGSTTKTVDGVGTYTVAADGTVTFVPEKSFVGTAPSVTVVREDMNGTKASSTYTPTVTPVTPTAEDATSTDKQGQTQSGKPTFTPGNSNVPMDDDVPATFEDGSTTKTIPGEGTYTLASDGTVTFVPEKSFTGTGTGVTVKRVDKNGTPVTAKYTPTVTPVTPTATPAESVAPQGVVQTGTVTFTEGDPVAPIDKDTITLLDENGKPATSVVAKSPEGKEIGTITVDKETGVVTFTPTDKSYSGEVVPVKVQAKDANGTAVETTYTPKITPVVPTAEPATSTDIQGKTQTGTPTFTPGNPAIPIDDKVPATFEDGSTEKKVPGEGTYTVAPDGTVTFTPEKNFTGKGTGVTVKRVDKNGTPVTAKYTPTVTPVTPTADPAETTDIQGKEQTGKPTFTPGNPDVPMDDEVPATFEDGSTEKKVPGEGTYTVAPDGTVTFVPEKGFTGVGTGVTVKRVDKNGTPVTAKYTPNVTPVTPTAEPAETTDIQGKEQTGKPTFTPGNPDVPMDDEVPATFEDGSTEKKVPGEGTYTVAPDGTVTFVPEKSFTGKGTGVTVKRVDKNGTPVTAKYTPTVTPVTPTAEDVKSTDKQGQTQTGKPKFTEGNPSVPMDDDVPATFEDGSTTKVISGEGTYTVTPDGTVTFTPEKTFTGKGTGVTVKRVDKNGTPVTAKYTPTVTPVSPTAEPVTSIGNKGQTQTGKPVFTEGDNRVPMNDKVPATFEDGSTTKTIPGVGTYTVAADGTVTFTPDPEFTGTAPAVTVVREDVNGTKAQATYTPTVRPITKFVDKEGKEIPGYPTEDGENPKKDIPGYRFVETKKLPNGDVEHVYEKVTTPAPTPSPIPQPNPGKQNTTTWTDENGNPLKPSEPGSKEPGTIPGYEYVKTVTDPNGNIRHIFRKVEMPTPTPVEPTQPAQPVEPATPAMPEQPAKPEVPTTPAQPVREAQAAVSKETEAKRELPNTGTEDNASLAALGLLGVLSGFGLVARKKKED
ncbi:LPXTG cell wall anchor domain-containing protein, partial [Streptococcus mitis]|uniref:LPXTG cell wall anchor domain-containing protein n=1 Tax=Streptococcus mitis TaxID=28037 RepID=UPI0022835F34